MLKITIPKTEMWNEQVQEFIDVEEQTLELEHSLVSLSKWESKWNKAFLTKQDKTDEEVLDYIKCMTLTPDVDPKVYYCLTDHNYEQVMSYIDESMTATYFSGGANSGANRERTTAELIYYWMIALNIPFECENWHLNRLITLIRVCSIKNQPPKKRSSGEIISGYAALNEERRKQLNSKG